MPHGVEPVDAGADPHGGAIRRLARCGWASRISRSPEATTPTCTARGGYSIGGELVGQGLHGRVSFPQGCRETAWPTTDLRFPWRQPAVKAHPVERLEVLPTQWGAATPPAVKDGHGARLKRHSTPRVRHGATRRCRRDEPPGTAARPTGPTVRRGLPGGRRAARAGRGAERGEIRPAPRPPRRRCRIAAAPCPVRHRHRRVALEGGVGNPGQAGGDVDRARHVTPQGGSGAQQAHCPEGASVGVDPAGGLEHGLFTAAAYRTESHPQVQPGSRIHRRHRTFGECAAQRLRRVVQHGEVHVGMCAGAPAVDQSRLRGQVSLGVQCRHGQIGDGVRGESRRRVEHCGSHRITSP